MPSSRVSHAMCEPEASRNAVRDYLENAADRIPGPVRLVDDRLHSGLGFGSDAAEQNLLALG